jgi:hypothetical protein
MAEYGVYEPEAYEQVASAHIERAMAPSYASLLDPATVLAVLTSLIPKSVMTQELELPAE